MKTAPGLIVITFLLFFYACRKDSFITSPDARVSLSVDSLKYDTVFTTTGSITQYFKISNENNQKLLISSVKLMGGSASSYKINADGFIGPEINNIEIAANDSIYVFVSVIINQNASNLPFIIKDSIKVSYNGTDKWVQLEAWGQNAHFFRNKKITANETWVNDLPYVILGSLTVDTNKILTIDKGCRIFIHADAPVIVDGTLLVNGQKDTIDRVYFQGDRLDDPYKDFPASWPGIYFRTLSKDNILNYAVIKNSYQAVALENLPPNLNPKLILKQCIIDNAYDAGIIAFNSSINATNCLISNCGYNATLFKGGNYQFNHCTLAGYSNGYVVHKNPVLILTDNIKINNVVTTANLTASFRNCIFWGEANGFFEDEVITDKKGTVFNVSFDKVLWRLQTPPAGLISGATNLDPVFDSINTSKKIFNFRLKGNSPAVNTGAASPVNIDLDGKTRPIGNPDLGAYEKQ